MSALVRFSSDAIRRQRLLLERARALAEKVRTPLAFARASSAAEQLEWMESLAAEPEVDPAQAATPAASSP